MTNGLRLTFEADTDGTGELFARVESAGFSGASSAWFDSEHLVEFAKSLANSYPLQPNEPLRLEGGFWNRTGSGIEQLHLGLAFYPIGSVGHVGCRVSLSTSIHEHDRPESQALVAVELHTSYEELRKFAQSLEMLAQRAVSEAVLESVG